MSLARPLAINPVALISCSFAVLLSGCADGEPIAPAGSGVVPEVEDVVAAFACTGSIAGDLSCTPANEALASGVRPAIIGSQGTYVTLDSSDPAYDPTTEIFTFDVTIQNLLNEAIGTPDGSTPDPDGIRIFFHQGPNVLTGTGNVTVLNADGVGAFTGSDQPYFSYVEILENDEVSAPRTWQLSMPSSVSTFNFLVFLTTDVEYRLVLNEFLTNPRNPISDAYGEWFEVYNAGTWPVDMQGLVIADSAASGRRPFHLIASPLVVPPGGYVVLGNNPDTAMNGGVTLDYAYGSALAFANSLDALKIARVVGMDTLTIDRFQYNQAAVSAQDGVSRELKNPALDNLNMDGDNWADALETAVYGPGGRGTPGAQNSTFTP